jgi:hypothetical protein
MTIAYPSTYATLLTIGASSALPVTAKTGRGIIETYTALFGRYYTSDTYDKGRRKAKTVKLADKSDIYRSKMAYCDTLRRLLHSSTTQPLMNSRWKTP